MLSVNKGEGIMKTKIMIGSCLAVCILMLVPLVPAVEYNTTVETNKSTLFEKIKNLDINGLDIEELKEKSKSNNGIITFIIWLLALTVGRVLSWVRAILLLLGIVAPPYS